MSRRIVLCLVLALSVAARVSTQRDAQSATSPPPVHVVGIDAIVVDGRGAAVTGLTTNDFQLSEDGVPQTITDVRLVSTGPLGQDNEVFPSIDSPAVERTEAARPGTRLVAVYVDEYHISPGADIERVRDALTGFVDRTLGPRDLLVVMKPLDSLFAIRLTRDRAEAKRTIAALDGRKGDYSPRTAYERNYMVGTPERVEIARTQVTVSALNGLAMHLGGLSDQRKSLIVVSEGFGRLPRQRGREYLSTIDSTLRAANRSRVSIYPIDPASSAGDGSTEEDERAPLRTLAAETDGRFITGAADLNLALARILTDSNTYYLLTYRASHVENGGFHEVSVGVKRPNVDVRARRGFWAPSFDDRLKASLLERAANPPPPRPVEPARHISSLIRPWFGFSAGDGGKTRVTFVWEASTGIFGDRARRGPPARLLLTALAPDGSVLFDGAVLPAGPGGLEDVGTPARVTFDQAPGRLRLRMQIEDAASDVLDTDVRDVTVRDLRRTVSIGTPLVFRARTAREFQAIDENSAAVPVSSREFSRTERLLIRVPAYSPAGDEPSVTARLLNRAGQPMRSLDIRRVDNLNRIELGLASLAVGDYSIEIAARGRNGDAKELLPFRVTN